MKTRYVTLLTTLACMSFASLAFAAKPNCPDPDDPRCEKKGDKNPIVYTFELTMGGFVVGPVDVTSNQRETSLRGTPTLEMMRPVDSGGAAAWDEVFDPCRLLNGVDSFEVGIGNWSIQSARTDNVGGAILLRMKDLDIMPAVDMDVDIDFELVGEGKEGFNGLLFLPQTAGDEHVFTLTHFVLYGQAKKGESCHLKGEKNPGLVKLQLESELVIKLKE